MINHSWAPNAYNCARQRWDAQYPSAPDPWETDFNRKTSPPFSVWGDQYTGLMTLFRIPEVVLSIIGPETEEDRLYREQGGGAW
jgi:hypothetical protein